MNALYSLPDLTIIAIFATTYAALGWLGTFVVRRLIRQPLCKDDLDVAYRVWGVVLSMNALLLAFSAVQTRNEMNRIERNVAMEANAVRKLDQTLDLFESPETRPAQDALIRYTRSIVEIGWPAMSKGIESPIVRETLEDLKDAILHLEPSTPRQHNLFQEALRGVDALQEFRQTRLLDANVHMSELFWWLIFMLSGGAILLGMLVPAGWLNQLSVTVLNASLGMIVAMVFVMDEPFLGDTSVSPRAFQLVLSDITPPAAPGR